MLSFFHLASTFLQSCVSFCRLAFYTAVSTLNLSGYGRSFFISYRSPAYLRASVAAGAEISSIRSSRFFPSLSGKVDACLSMSFFFQFARTLRCQLPRLPRPFIIVLPLLTIGIFIPDCDRFFFFVRARAMTNVLISKDFARSCLPRTRIGCFPRETALGMFVLMAK